MRIGVGQSLEQVSASVSVYAAFDSMCMPLIVRLPLPERASCRKGNDFLSVVGFLAMSRQRAGRAVAAAIAALLLAACGGSPQASVDPGARPELPVAAAAVANQLPKVTVWDVGGKQWVQFGNFLPADQPVLVWFWAPQ